MIFYFSCTGNTRWAAEMLATELREELVDMAHDSRDSYHLEEDERIGFCFPVHGWRPPVLVRRFIDKLVIENADGHFCWALCTAGDDIGQSMEYLNDDLKRNGLQAQSLFSLIMPESYVGLPFMDVDKPEKEMAKRKLPNGCSNHSYLSSEKERLASLRPTRGIGHASTAISWAKPSSNGSSQTSPSV